MKVGRPVNEREALIWDVKMAREYKALASNEGFVHLFQNLLEMRRQMLESLVADDGSRGGVLRGAIFVIDSLLRLPDEMVNNGAAAETELREGGFDDE